MYSTVYCIDLEECSQFGEGLSDGVLVWMGAVRLRPSRHRTLEWDGGRADTRVHVVIDGGQVEL